MATYIDGIAASENIDSSGERIIVAGMDISQLPIDGVFNYEHESKHPDQVVGKVLLAKKIFSDKDCETDRQLYFWNKCQAPYVYVMGELFDDYKESAKEVAGMFKYDHDKRGQNERNVMNFSIEGGKIHKDGIDILKSIARKVTITVLPCNKAAEAEMVPNEAAQPKQKDDLASLFKSETEFKTSTDVEIEMLKSEDIASTLQLLKKSLIVHNQAPAGLGTHLGQTKSGKDIHSHEKVHNYQGFGSQDHRDAANLHYNAIKSGTDAKTNQHHMNKMKLHMQAAGSAEKREMRGQQSVQAARMKAGVGQTPHASVHRPYAKVGDLGKSLTAGSGNVAPGQLTNGAALSKQCVDPKLHKGCTHGDLSKSGEKGVHQASFEVPETEHKNHSGVSVAGAATRWKEPQRAKDIHRQKLGELKAMPKLRLTKAEWLARAEEEYKAWGQREAFEKFMSEKHPNMTKTEIMVHGQTMALKKALEAEEKLEDLTKGVLKFGDGNYTKHTGEDATPKAPPKHLENHKSDVKGVSHTEVEHVHPHYDGKSADTIYTKAGHKLEGHAKGKFKVGDKVTVRPHLQGTHIMTHGHE